MRLAKETRRAVIEALKMCVLYERMGYHPGYEPRMTPSYTLAKPQQTNWEYSTTEETAHRNLETEQQRRAHVERVRGAMRVLSEDERNVIERRYFQDMRTPQIAMELYMSERWCHAQCNRALIKLALALGLLSPEEEREAAAVL
ncbi:ArpU family phage packaging/lysis transcriptional regulator [Alicyclobacillus kakegawensis]|uniref:ArpU family phage packaging/lysis transcriptional regulator n=1 Tax=Alicyclobacillus kakegawensis TaxID=392012 RepID=UPI0008314B2B|nr:ArpU family phage packaging/lysis transcriptional regulator [Alicyclobacillus kakegawensis]